MPDCEKYFDLISAYIDGELTASEEAELHTHLASCSHCRAVYDALAGISGELRSDLADPPEDLSAKVMSAVRAENGYPLAGVSREPKKRRAVIYRRAALAAACIAVVIFAVPTLSKFGRMGSTGGSDNFAPAPSAAYDAKSDGALPAPAEMDADYAVYEAASEEEAVDESEYETEPASNGADGTKKADMPEAQEEPSDTAHGDAYHRNWEDVQNDMDGGFDLVITVRGDVPERFDGLIFYDGGGDVASYAVISLEEAEALISGLDTASGNRVVTARHDSGTGLALVLVK